MQPRRGTLKLGSTDARQLKDIGFDCWALDQINAPQEVIGFLCKVANIHRVVRPLTPHAADAAADDHPS